jgi:hypothetical protein
MARVGRWLMWLWAWIRSWFVRKPTPLRTVHLEELPDQLDPKAVYVLGEGKHRWFAAMLCPCGCGATVQVSLMPESRPRWRLIEHGADGTVSLDPSLWREGGCESHFFLRRGLIQWCPPGGRRRVTTSNG